MVCAGTGVKKQQSVAGNLPDTKNLRAISGGSPGRWTPPGDGPDAMTADVAGYTTHYGLVHDPPTPTA